MEDPGSPSSNFPPSLDSTLASGAKLNPYKYPPTISPKRVVKEARLRATPPRTTIVTGKEPPTTRTRSKSTRTAPIAGKPLVPVTERRVHEDKITLPHKSKEISEQKWDVVPDGGSAGREGRQFTVANVGNNGRIYLRPTVRPAHQRPPQPEFSFPVTPPGTAGLEALGSPRKQDVEIGSELHYSQWTPTPRPSPPSNKKRYLGESSSNVLFTRHHRAMSDSTIQDATAAKETDTGAFKIVISKPGDDQRPKTAEDANLDALLDVSIPSWRIGVPRFTSTGTPLIRGSSYASSEVSGFMFDRSQKDLNFSIPTLGSRRPSTLKVPQARLSRTTQPRSPKLDPASTTHPLRLTYMNSRVIIEPAMFDNLTFRPACDDRSIVRYAPLTGVITAASPSRLVAEITSPSFLDYELISDFFLTFRTFLEPNDLLQMLVARLRWAVARTDETGMIVHVRAFVALRHWILNYFVDDFVVDHDLRVNFCNSVNDFVGELAQDASKHQVQLKILNELKKCWRRVCAHYWDGPDFDDTPEASVPITPGGIAGNRDPDLDPTFWEQQASGPPNLDVLCPVPEATTTSFYADVSKARHLADSVVENRPTTPENRIANTAEDDFGAISPTSMSSMDVVSCSFPGKHIRTLPPNVGNPLGAHPVSSSSVYNQTSHVAPTPKALVGKRVRPNQSHQRNDSLPDSLREQSPDKVSFKDQEFLMTSPFAGSLVRGNAMPPSQAFVDVTYQSQNRGVTKRQTTVFQPQVHGMHQQDGLADAMSGRGMKKLIGSVRRALSTRGQAMSPPHGAVVGGSVFGLGKSATNRLPGTAVVPQNMPNGDGPRPPVRIDLLGAEVAEDFKQAVREDAAHEAEKWGLAMEPPKSAPLGATDMEYSAAHLDSSIFDSLPQNRGARPASDTALSGGSKSILIVDGTVPLDARTIRDGIPTANPSVEAFVDTLMPNFGNITPPTTPPTQFDEVLRRSSHLLNENVQRTFAQEPLPAFIPDFATLGPRSSTHPSENGRQLSQHRSRHSRRHPPVSAGIPRLHRRNRSTRTQQSLNSILHNRGASFSSDVLAPSTIPSFDATSFSQSSVAGTDVYSPVPKPLRGLRRRPGGDLRAATNVGDLSPQVLRRSQSLGSLSIYSDSVRSFTFHKARRSSLEDIDSMVDESAQQNVQTFSVGQLANKPAKRELSLCSTGSDKPIMRPSFEAEAKKLAQIPDDEDDGGVESALLKLEGKFEKRPAKRSVDAEESPPLTATERAHVDSFGVLAVSDSSSHNSDQGYQSIMDDATVSKQDDQGSEHAGRNLEVPRQSAIRLQSFLSDDSRESYSSIPLLDRGLTDDDHSKRATRDWADRSILQDSDDEAHSEPVDRRDLSYEIVQKTDSMDQIKFEETVPSSHEQQSFLDSDLSSELSDDSTETRGPEHMQPTLQTHEPSSHDHAPLPIQNNLTVNVEPYSGMPMVYKQPTHEDLASKPLPPTPEASPAGPFGNSSPNRQADSSGAIDQQVTQNHEARKYSVHLPFVLAFDSETLAQQFTLIEKDALNEIDWKELVDMDWKNTTNSDSRSWVDFLRNTDAHGVEVVIARFNLVVKWAISEIVLTQHIEERAKCIIKYIHIASHCRKYRNFATLAQLTVALSTNEISRLSRTWELVTPSDMKTLRELEALVTPMRNFYNLRAEMESASDARCIPFVGIYTHDLLYNGQRPAEIASSPTTAPLVNFERCRTGAAVIKTLLRLLEASTQYDFQPVEGITERCLWIGALGDEEIRRHSAYLD